MNTTLQNKLKQQLETKFKTAVSLTVQWLSDVFQASAKIMTQVIVWKDGNSSTTTELSIIIGPKYMSQVSLTLWSRIGLKQVLFFTD